MNINPMAPEQHPETIINVVNGRTAPLLVNVDKAIGIGTPLPGASKMSIWASKISQGK